MVGALAVVIVLGATGARLHAGDKTSGHDAIPSNVRIDISLLGNHPVTLVKILQEVEKQTEFRFVYVASDLPLQTTLLLEAGNTVSLDRLLKNVTLMLDVAFQRCGKIIVVRPCWALPRADASAQGRNALPATSPATAKRRPLFSAKIQLNRRFYL